MPPHFLRKSCVRYCVKDQNICTRKAAVFIFYFYTSETVYLARSVALCCHKINSTFIHCVQMANSCCEFVSQPPSSHLPIEPRNRSKNF